jgi:hypothetical protein
MMFTFSRDRQGRVDVHGSDDLDMLASFLLVDAYGTGTLGHWIDGIEEARTRPGSDALVGEGFTLDVRGADTVVESNFDLFPAGTYPTDLVLGSLRQFRDWLRDNPHPPGRAASGPE